MPDNLQELDTHQLYRSHSGFIELRPFQSIFLAYSFAFDAQFPVRRAMAEWSSEIIFQSDPASSSEFTVSSSRSGSVLAESRVQSLAVARDGSIFACDRNNARIVQLARALETDKQLSQVFAIGGERRGPNDSRHRGFQDGPADTALFHTPEGIAIDRAGNIFIAVTKHCVSAHFTCWWRAQDSFNSVIRRYNAATKTVGTYAGVPRPRWVGIDGPRAQATFWNPTSLALDRFGNLFVAGVNSLPL